MKNIIATLNTNIFLFIFNNFNKNKLISRFFIIISNVSHYLFFILYFLGFIYTIFFIKNLIFNYISILIFTLIINKILRVTFKVKRPSENLNIKSFLYHKNNYGFPSNHSACSMAVTICLISINIKFKLLIFLVILTGFSRVVVGLHYPLDVFAGFFIGYFCGKIFF